MAPLFILEMFSAIQIFLKKDDHNDDGDDDDIFNLPNSLKMVRKNIYNAMLLWV